MGAVPNHPEFREVVEYTNDLKLEEVKSSLGPNPSVGQLLTVTLKGMDLSYINKETEQNKKVALAPHKHVKIVDRERLIFKVQIQNEVQSSEVWTFSAGNKEIFDAFTDNIKKSQRPRWVEESANKCWLCDRHFTCCLRQHHCRRCGIAVCRRCCRTSMRLPEYAYYAPVYVCDKCVGAIRNAHSESLNRKLKESSNS
eukprot:TRINITY_DN514_c0_g1_i18.p1 TRINITY_DN514_c0_g1~~TRINITY_DN514_c0_g1_i18.p1  ORF type:complete len:198 (-),score=36.77 TRINITY_DN514_c0_g1_i18:155-748(-)